MFTKPYPGRTYTRFVATFALLVLSVLSAMPAWAQEEEPTLSSGDTAWMLTATALVLFMTIPGLSLFYGGLVNRRNVLSVLMQCFTMTALMTLLWTIYGYSFAFDTTGMEAVDGYAFAERGLHGYVGGLKYLFLRGIDRDALTGTIPESVFVTFQMTFAIITPALIIGAFAERMKFSAVLIFSTLWFTLVYAPICHMVWSGDGALFWDLGVLDFAGGTVVHINAGTAALVACIVVGKRKGYPERPMPPHNLTMTVTGAGMLWVGWFGFNAGSALAADQNAGMAMLVTQVATAAATLAWTAAEWIKHGKPSVLGAVTGAVAGLVAITPASGTVGPMGAIAIGLASGFICFFAATTMKRALGYDDALDAFGVHGVGGFVGAMLTGVFASKGLGGFEIENSDIAGQLWLQFFGCALTFVYCGIVSFVLLKLIDVTLGLRVTEQKEIEGLDVTEHEETGYSL